MSHWGCGGYEKEKNFEPQRRKGRQGTQRKGRILNESWVASVLFLFDDTAFEFGDEFGLGGEDGAVFGGEELFAAFEDGVLDDGFVLIGAEDQADGGIVVGAAFEVVKHADVHPMR